MSKNKWAIVLVLAIIAAIGVGVFLGYTHLICYNGHFYPREAKALDLREETLTAADYHALSEELPQCYILWSIPFQGGSLSSDAESLTLTSLTDSDVAQLDYATNLQRVDGTGCTDYAQLVQLQKRHPGARVLYQMTISGVECDQDTTELTLEGLTQDDAQLLHYLPNLTQVSVSGCQDYALLTQLQSNNPQWNLSYTVTLGTEEFSWDSETISVQDATCDQLTAALPALPQLKQLALKNPKGDGQTLVALREAYPAVEIRWQVALYGQTVTEDVVELDISGIQVASCQEVEQAVSCLPNLERLIMSDCGIDNETMAAFRERQRGNYKVVWTVSLGTRKALGNRRFLRTDTTKLWANCYYYGDELVNLKYCEDMIALDLGHTGVKNIDFVSYMPHLTYLILAHTPTNDISPLSSCKELKFLELDWSLVTDYSPLLGCTGLEDLNLGLLDGDAEPIAKMTWLKNLWWKDCKYQKQQLLTEALPDTTLMFSMSQTVGNGWRKLQNYYDMRDALGAYYMT